MRSRTPAVLTMLSAVVFVSCDQQIPTDPPQVASRVATLLDGSSGGNPHFFFLPPLVKKASFSGEFNAELAPTVEICTNTQQRTNGQCSTLLARFRRFPGPDDDPQTIEVSVKGKHYVLNWKTREHVVPEQVPFRVVVLIGSIQLGHIDLIRAGNQFRNHATNTVINRTTNGDLPLNFRIERGALCGDSPECFEGMVGPEGGTFTIKRPDGTRPAGTEFPVGALEQTVTLIIERYTGECLPTDAPQYQGCYRFRTEPHLDEFELPATVGVCLFDESALPLLESDQLRLWKWSEVAGDGIEELERVAIDYLVCPQYTTVGANQTPSLLLGASRAASILLKPLARLMLPRPAYAFAFNEGGKLINFSRIGWVRPLTVEIKAGDNQTAPAGTQLPDALRIRVTNKYGQQVQGIAGWPVTFTPSADGAAQPPAAITDPAGEATTMWTLATTPGANTLRARALTSRGIAAVPYEADAVFGSSGTVPIPALRYQVLWQPPLGPSFHSVGNWKTGMRPTVTIRATDGPILETMPATEEPEGYAAEWHLAGINPALTYRIAVLVNNIEQNSIDLKVQDGVLRNAATGAKVMDVRADAILRIRFRLTQ